MLLKKMARHLTPTDTLLSAKKRKEAGKASSKRGFSSKKTTTDKGVTFGEVPGQGKCDESGVICDEADELEGWQDQMDHLVRPRPGCLESFTALSTPGKRRPERRRLLGNNMFYLYQPPMPSER